MLPLAPESYRIGGLGFCLQRICNLAGEVAGPRIAGIPGHIQQKIAARHRTRGRRLIPRKLEQPRAVRRKGHGYTGARRYDHMIVTLQLNGVKLCTLFGVLFKDGPTGGAPRRRSKARL